MAANINILQPIEGPPGRPGRKKKLEKKLAPAQMPANTLRLQRIEGPPGHPKSPKSENFTLP